ncbi:hypothetical protein ACFVGN_34485 [Streptomyces sp. NPDC057757]|uniref:hypothetical protein n=1 Tax=Streptomyces sp. NPDC057757 TaxID=3346241 RepID=UPI0036C5F139
MTDLREQRRRSDESYRVNPGLGLRRRAAPAPPTATRDLVWDQVTEQIATTVRTLTEPARRPVLSSDARDTPAALLGASGDACRFDEYAHRAEGRPRDGAGRTRDFRHSLARASAEHRRLTALLRIADPEAALIPRPSARRHEQARVGG